MWWGTCCGWLGGAAPLGDGKSGADKEGFNWVGAGAGTTLAFEHCEGAGGFVLSSAPRMSVGRNRRSDDNRLAP